MAPMKRIWRLSRETPCISASTAGTSAGVATRRRTLSPSRRSAYSLKALPSGTIRNIPGQIIGGGGFGAAPVRRSFREQRALGDLEARGLERLPHRPEVNRPEPHDRDEPAA